MWWYNAAVHDEVRSQVYLLDQSVPSATHGSRVEVATAIYRPAVSKGVEETPILYIHAQTALECFVSSTCRDGLLIFTLATERFVSFSFHRNIHRW